MADTPAAPFAAQAHDMGTDILADLQRMVEQGTPPVTGGQSEAPAAPAELDIAARKDLARKAIDGMRGIIEKYEAEAASAVQAAEAQATADAAAAAQAAEAQRAASVESGVADIKAKYGL